MQFFTDLAASLGNQPVLQGLLAAGGTLVLEDPTTVGCGLLVADGLMSYWAAFIGLSLGIAGGDFGLYLLGRLAQNKVTGWGFIDEARFASACRWFNRNVVLAVVSSRFLPGARLPTYVAAGILKVSPLKFLATAVAASVAWTFLLLWFTIVLGQDLLHRAGNWKWPLGLGLLAVIIAAQWAAARHRKDEAASEQGNQPAPPAVSLFELWPAALFMLPVGAWYLWLSIRHGHAALPTAANPSIYTGGMIGESKCQILSLAPAETLPYIAPWVCLPMPAVAESGQRAFSRAKAALAGAGLCFPLVAKPDVGQRGDGVRRVRNDKELAAYLAAFPAGEAVVLQKLAPFENEAGIFWYRLPGEPRGRIFSITSKRSPVLLGDGCCTLAELIQKDRRARHFSRVYYRRHADKLQTVPAAGSRLPLVFSGNHCQGAVFENGWRLYTKALEEKINQIADSLPEFYFGRLDLRYESDQKLMAGEGFLIVEINGASSEATHIWDAKTTLRQAYGTLFRQFSILFEIGARNRARGHKPMPVWQLLREVKRYRARAVRYPPTE